MKCENCGNELVENSMFCDVCGTKVVRSEQYKCVNCGNIFGEDEKFCAVCGSKREENSSGEEYGFCANCGAKMLQGEMFCANCGAAAGKVVESVPSKKKNGSGLAIAVIVAAIIIALAGAAVGTYFIYMSNNEEKTENVSIERANDNGKGVEQNATSSVAPSITPTVMPTPTNSALRQGRDEYLFDSDKVLVTNVFLDTLSREQVRLILNEMYARHGYIFSLEQYKQYFSAKTWYIPRYTSAEEAETYFNDFERQNKGLIVNYEKAKGWR